MWSGLLTALTHRVKVISFNHTRHTSHSFPPILFMLICSAHAQLSDKLQVSHSPLSRLSWRTDLLLRVNFSSAEKFGAIQHTYVLSFLELCAGLICILFCSLPSDNSNLIFLFAHLKSRCVRFEFVLVNFTSNLGRVKFQLMVGNVDVFYALYLFWMYLHWHSLLIVFLGILLNVTLKCVR